jgi:hypothetical protein
MSSITIAQATAQATDLRMRVLEKLGFPEMNDRCKMIENRVGEFGDTYCWVFYPPPRTDSYRQHEFVTWLREGSGVFWLDGKPGSGKSSLMAYIYHNLGTDKVGFHHLRAWAQPQSFRLLSFWFFRPAKSLLLKSLGGFWRSLCSQILEVDERLFETIRDNNNNNGSAPESLRQFLRQLPSHDRFPADPELKDWFEYLVTHSQYRFCILADGLDEVENFGERQNLLDAIKYIGSFTEKVKICCSSRPEPQIHATLHPYPSLRLQEFNYEDIELHCHNRLEGTRAAGYASRITRQANGVFLWAALVAMQILSGVQQHDSDAELDLRFRNCPAEMDELLIHLLKRQDAFYAKSPKPYLGLIAAATTVGCNITLLELLLASQEQNKLAANFPDKLPANFQDNLLQFCQDLSDVSAVDPAINMVARCAGLVECVNDERYHPKAGHHESLVTLQRMNIRFIHRSVHDFLFESAPRDVRGISDEEAFKRMVSASAIYSIINNYEREYYTYSCMKYSQRVSKSHWTRFETTVLDALFTAAQERYPVPLPIQTADIDYSSLHNIVLIDREPYSQEIWCPHLSAIDNRLLYNTAKHCILPCLEEKLANFDRKLRSLAIGFCILCLIRTEGCLADIGRVSQFLSHFQTQLSWSQDLTIFHFSRELMSSFLSRRPLYEHVHLASVALLSRRDPPYTTKVRQDLREFFSSLLPGNGTRPRIDGWSVIAEKGNYDIHVLPVPDQGAAFRKESVYGHILATSTLLNDPEKPSFSQYAPWGSVFFLDVEPRINKALQQLLTGNSPSNDTGDSTLSGHFADILNCHLDELTPYDIAWIVKENGLMGFHYFDPAPLIFSKGRFRGVTKDEADSWAERLRLGIFDQDFETDRENDPILGEIMEVFEDHWRRHADIYKT